MSTSAGSFAVQMISSFLVNIDTLSPLESLRHSGGQTAGCLQVQQGLTLLICYVRKTHQQHNKTNPIQFQKNICLLCCSSLQYTSLPLSGDFLHLNNCNIFIIYCTVLMFLQKSHCEGFRGFDKVKVNMRQSLLWLISGECILLKGRVVVRRGYIMEEQGHTQNKELL